MEIANFFLKNMMHELTSPKCNSNKTTLSPSENCYNYSINRIANHAMLSDQDLPVGETSRSTWWRSGYR